jgi:hypothetical protein
MTIKIESFRTKALGKNVSTVSQQGFWLKDGNTIINVKENFDGRVFGDVDFESAEKVASWITPVPGGVGPMTICLDSPRLTLRTGISQLIKAIIAPSPLRKPFSNNFIFPLLPYRRLDA